MMKKQDQEEHKFYIRKRPTVKEMISKTTSSIRYFHYLGNTYVILKLGLFGNGIFDYVFYLKTVLLINFAAISRATLAILLCTQFMCQFRLRAYAMNS